MVAIALINEETWQKLKKKAFQKGFQVDKKFAVIRKGRFGIVANEKGEQRELLLSEYAVPGQQGLEPATQDEWNEAEGTFRRLLEEVYHGTN